MSEQPPTPPPPPPGDQPAGGRPPGDDSSGGQLSGSGQVPGGSQVPGGQQDEPAGQPSAAAPGESAEPQENKPKAPLFVLAALGLIGAAVITLGVILVMNLGSDDDDAGSDPVAEQDDSGNDTENDEGGDDTSDESVGDAETDAGDETDASDEGDAEADADPSGEAGAELGDDASGAAADDGSTDDSMSGDESEATEIDVFNLEVGDCVGSFGTADSGDVDYVELYPCEAEHQQQIILITEIEATELPEPAAIEQQITEECLPAFETFVGVPYEESELYINYLEPTEESWAQGDREIVCAVEDPASMVAGSLEGAGR